MRLETTRGERGSPFAGLPKRKRVPALEAVARYWSGREVAIGTLVDRQPACTRARFFAAVAAPGSPHSRAPTDQEVRMKPTVNTPTKTSSDKVASRSRTSKPRKNSAAEKPSTAAKGDDDLMSTPAKKP